MKNTYLCKPSREFLIVSTTNFLDGSFATGYDPSAWQNLHFLSTRIQAWSS